MDLQGRPKPDEGRFDPTGPLPHTTLRDAIHDLLPFEWENPDAPNPARHRFNPQQFIPRQPIGFINPVEYDSPPRTNFQRAARISLEGENVWHVQDAVGAHRIRGHEYKDLPRRYVSIGVEGEVGKHGDARGEFSIFF